MSIMLSWAIKRDIEEIIRKNEQANLFRRKEKVSVGDLIKIGKEIHDEMNVKEELIINKLKEKIPYALKVTTHIDLFEKAYIVQIETTNDKKINFVYYSENNIGCDCAFEKEKYDELKVIIRELVNHYIGKNEEYEMVSETISSNYRVKLKNSKVEIRLSNNILDYLNKELVLVLPYNEQKQKKVIKTKYGDVSVKTNMAGIYHKFKMRGWRGSNLENFLDNLMIYETEIPEKLNERVKTLRKK